MTRDSNVRKLATAAAVSLVLNTGVVYGLGLGDIEMRSALNQPMNAEIRLTSVKSGETEGMIVQLASPDAFARAGIERSSALTDLSFSVDSSTGTPVIRISSKKAVVEPFLNFLLEVDWPQGRMVREYTVLLDPPVFMTQSETTIRDASTDQPAIVERGEQAIVTPVPIVRDTDDALIDGFDVEIVGSAEELLENADGEAVSLDSGEAVSLDPLVTPDEGEVVALTDLAAPNTDAATEDAAGDVVELSDDLFEVELVGGDSEVSDDFITAGGADVVASEGESVSLDVLDSTENALGEMTVESGDTLYEIAQDNAVNGVSVQQMMMALLAANQSAFIDDNINLVKAGAILRVPEAAEAQAMSQKQALAAIVQQNQLWQAYRDSLQQDRASTRVADAETSAPTGTGTGTDSSTAESDASASNASDADNTEDLSSSTQEILDNARNEVADRDELTIVADSDSPASSASATSDTDEAADNARLGEINRKLQLAREELTASRLESDEIDDRTSKLTSTTENLDALVTLRQNEVAQLEAQLADVKTDAAEAVAEAEAEAVAEAEAEAEAVAEAEAEAEAVAEAASSNATDASGNAIAEAADDAVADMAEAATDAVGDAASEATDAANDAVEVATDALDSDAAGVDSDTADTSEIDAESVPVKQTVWYKDLLNDPKRLAIAGVGGVGLLGILGTLVFRRKRPVDELAMDDSAVQVIDDEEAARLQTEMTDQSADDTIDGTAAAGAAAIAGGVALASDDETEEPAVSSATLAAFDAANETKDWGSETQAVADATSDDGLDKDDTISEVDVYLAYGLHGQAEELLTKAIERKPEHPEYVQKLLQTYHAQGNADGFHQAAQEFHSKFGGESNPDWSAIAVMGQELRPNDALYSSATGDIASVGLGDYDAPKMQADDFALAGADSTTGSISRGDFSSSDATLDVSADESALMDQSLDPAFAFDEGDLEATGDFSQIASELAQEEGSIDFPDLGDTDGALGAAVAGTAGLGGLAAASASAADALATGDSTLQDAMSLDGFDISSGGIDSGAANDSDESLDFSTTADDLTLDLDQLTGEMELDGTEMLDDSVSDLEIPDLTADNDQLLNDDVGTGADEMDTMMDLAKAYIDMGDKDSASSALGEIVKGGSPEQVSQAESLLRKIS